MYYTAKIFGFGSFFYSDIVNAIVACFFAQCFFIS